MYISSSSVDSKHRIKSVTYTLLVYMLLFLLFFAYSTTRVSTPVPYEDAIQVNLGEVDDAYGNEPSTAYVTRQSPASEVKKKQEKIVSPIPLQQLTNTAQSEDAILSEAETSNPNSQIPQENEELEKQEETREQKQPLALFKPGVEPDSNERSWKDSYSDVTGNQGVTSGSGDMGSLYGVPTSENYMSSISIVDGLGNRSLDFFPKIQEDFDNEGTILVKVLFSRDGLPLSVTQDIRNSTTTKKQLVDIARTHAQKIRLNADAGAPYQQAVTFRFIFKLTL